MVQYNLTYKVAYEESANRRITLAEKLRQRLPGMWEKVGKTQVSFYLGCQFGCASLLAVRRKAERPDPYLTVSFGLAHPWTAPGWTPRPSPIPIAGPTT